MSRPGVQGPPEASPRSTIGHATHHPLETSSSRHVNVTFNHVSLRPPVLHYEPVTNLRLAARWGRIRPYAGRNGQGQRRCDWGFGGMKQDLGACFGARLVPRAPALTACGGQVDRLSPHGPLPSLVSVPMTTPSSTTEPSLSKFSMIENDLKMSREDEAVKSGERSGAPGGVLDNQSFSLPAVDAGPSKSTTEPRVRIASVCKRNTQINLAGTATDLLEQDHAIEIIIESAESGSETVLGVASVNLDHIHHFSSSRLFQLGSSESAYKTAPDQQVRWLHLLDGAPLVRRASKLTGYQWPRLAGSDLIEPILNAAEDGALSVGFLGGLAATHADLAGVMSKRWPHLRVAGYWAPARADLTDPVAAEALRNQIAQAEVSILFVCLGKPRQEEWIANHGYASGARVCLAFGAAVDFLAGRIARAPRWISNHGLEWAWRLALEPRRLTRRYLIQGPPAYLALKRNSHVIRSLQC
jgi:exopolysaccharide biosynthesis WecB/TagA/CpsF family protein